MKTWLVSLLLVLAMVPTASASPARLPASVQIRNAHHDLLLRPLNASRQDGAPLVLYPAQPWRCLTWDTAVTAEGHVRLRNRFSGKTFAPDGDAAAAPLRQIPWPQEEASAPAWRIALLTEGLAKIIDPRTERALTARESAAGLIVTIEPWQDLPSQKWRIEAAPARLTM